MRKKVKHMAVDDKPRYTLSGKRVVGMTAMHSLYGIKLLTALQGKPIFAGIPNRGTYRAQRRTTNRAARIARRLNRGN